MNKLINMLNRLEMLDKVFQTTQADHEVMHVLICDTHFSKEKILDHIHEAYQDRLLKKGRPIVFSTKLFVLSLGLLVRDMLDREGN